MIQYIIQTKNSLYGLKIDKGEYTIGKLLAINESLEVEVGDTFHGDKIIFNFDGTLSIFNAGDHQLTTSPVTSMNLIQKE